MQAPRQEPFPPVHERWVGQIVFRLEGYGLRSNALSVSRGTGFGGYPRAPHTRPRNDFPPRLLIGVGESWVAPCG